MNLTVRFKNMKNSKFLNKMAHDEAKKLTKYFDGRFSINFSLTKSDVGHISMVKIIGPNFSYHSKNEDNSVMKSLTGSFEKISKQLERKKEKTRNKIRKNNLKSPKHTQVLRLIKNEEEVMFEIEQEAAA